MVQANKAAASITILVFAMLLSCSTGLAQTKDTKRIETFDPVDFIKSFRIGMSYVEVQALLPKHAEQDILAYLPSEESFLLGVDIPGEGSWSASFKFDTLETPARRPEQLIEFSCSAGLSIRSETFETIVRRVTAAFGEPVELDRSHERFQQAGWRVSGGSLLTLEYSTAPGAPASNVNVEFVIKKKPVRNLPDSRAVA